MFVADALQPHFVKGGMLDSKGLIAELGRLRAQGVTSNAEIGRLLNLPSSRVAEVFAGRRAIKIDEMKLLVDRYGLEQSGGPSLSANTLEPLIDALLPMVPPPGRMTDQSRRALAEALAYGLELLRGHPANHASEDAVGVAARAAVARYRDLVN